VVFTDETRSLARTPAVAALPAPVLLAAGWRLQFPDEPSPQDFGPLRSWTEDPSRLYFSA
jgi:hypothetical protein